MLAAHRGLGKVADMAALTSDPFQPPDPEAPLLPDWPVRASKHLTDESATSALAALVATVLDPGDTILLSGWLGTGKTHFARALIRAALDSPDEPVPSPSFTLVQTYARPDSTEIWHADLYRLSDAQEVAELGLDAAFAEAICLIEWPDRLAPDWPRDAALLHLDYAEGENRTATLRAPADTLLGARLTHIFAQ